MKRVVLLFEWKHLVELVKEENKLYPIVHQGRARQTVEYNEKLPLSEQIPKIKEAILRDIENKYWPKAERRAEEMGDRPLQQFTRLFNVREATVWSDMEDFTT